MFEARSRGPSPVFWKILPLALLIFAAIVGLMVYLSGDWEVAEEDLQGVLKAGDSDFDWYHKYVDLEDPKISMARNLAGKRMVIFSGVIHNFGERTLDVVQVRLSFFNYDQPVYQTVRTPVRPGPYTPPIGPLEKRKFTLYVQDLPEGWRASNAEMEICGLRFLREERFSSARP